MRQVKVCHLKAWMTRSDEAPGIWGKLEEPASRSAMTWLHSPFIDPPAFP